MAAIVQYSTYSSVPSAALDLFLSKLSLLDQYIIMTTGQNEYQMLVKHIRGDIELYTVDRPGTTYNNTWRISVRSATDFSWSVSNEYYVSSNVGLGTLQHLPCYDLASSVSLQVIVVFIVFWVLFRSIFFRSVKRK